jgi:hypothetical protein
VELILTATGTGLLLDTSTEKLEKETANPSTSWHYSIEI